MDSSTTIYIGIAVVLLLIAIYYFYFRTSSSSTTSPKTAAAAAAATATAAGAPPAAVTAASTAAATAAGAGAPPAAAAAAAGIAAAAINIASPPPGYYIDSVNGIASVNPGDQWPANWCKGWFSGTGLDLPYFQLTKVCNAGTTTGLLNNGGGKCASQDQTSLSNCMYQKNPGPSPFTNW